MSHTFVLLSILLCCSIGINHYKLRNCHAAFQSKIGISGGIPVESNFQVTLEPLVKAKNYT